MARERKPKPRYQHVERRQMQWCGLSLDQRLPPDHVARDVWEYCQGLDLSALYDQIQTVEDGPGRSPVDPRVLLALWLLATIDGVGAARELDRLCTHHTAYLWLLGGCTVNYHLLSDFRHQHVDFLDDLLKHSVAAMDHQGLIELNSVAQDGMRVRASAGQSSFRREESLEDCLAKAEAHLAEVKARANDNDHQKQAAQERGARDRSERIQAALAEHQKLAAKKEARKKGSGKTARVSTTDPEARVMKMADGGFRPAYNVQFATTTGSRVIVGVDVVNEGTDGGQMLPMLEQLEQCYGQRPESYFADGSFCKLDDITALERRGVEVYLPVMEKKQQEEKGVDPYAKKKGDTPEVAGWRERMGTAEAQKLYPERASTAEFSNAGCRNRGLYQFQVRGLLKVRAVCLWHALAHNFQRLRDLQRPSPAPAT